MDDYHIFDQTNECLAGVIGCGEGVVYLNHWGVQLILAYSWARPAILVADKGRVGEGISSDSSLSFLFSFFPVFFISSTVSSISILPFSGDDTK